MSTQPIVVTAPVMFVQTVAKEISDQLCQTLATHRVVIVDLTETLVCDLAALGELSTAHELATAGDRELRLVVSSASIMRQSRSPD